MAVVPDQLQAPQGGLSQVAPPAQASTPINPTKAAMNAAIDEEEAPIDPIEKATRKMAVDREALTAQIDKLSKSLEARQNLPFNPMYLDIARAAAKPASTGNAIEALGNIGGAYGDAYLKENQRQIDIEKDQIELFKQKQALNQAGLEQELRINYFKDPSAKKMPAGAPAAPVGAAPSAPATTGGTQTIESPPDLVQPNQMRRITANDIAMLQGVSPKLAEELKGLSKLQREAQVVSTEGIWDTMAGKWVVKFQSSIERPMRVIGNVKMTKDQSDKYDQLERSLQGKSEQEKNDAVANFAADAGLGGVRRTNGEIVGFKSESERTLLQEEASQRIKDKLKSNADSVEIIYKAGLRAQPTIQAAQITYKLATGKDTQGAFGVLNKPGVLNAMAVAVAEFTDRQGSFGSAGLEKAIRTAGGSEKELQAASYVVSLQGLLQLMAAQDYLKGQGAVSDAERRLIANLVGNLSDTPKSVAMKAKVIEGRARFDQLVSDAYYRYENDPNNKNPTVQDFYRIKDGEFKTLFKEYDEHMSGLYSHYFGGNTPAANAPPAPAAPPKAPTAQGQTPKAPRPVGPLEQRLRDKKKAGS